MKYIILKDIEKSRTSGAHDKWKRKKRASIMKELHQWRELRDKLSTKVGPGASQAEWDKWKQANRSITDYSRELKEIKKSQVKGFTRTKKGKLEIVKLFSRQGEKSLVDKN